MDKYLIIFHPTTPIAEPIGYLLNELGKQNSECLFVLPNTDNGAGRINSDILWFCEGNSDREWVVSLPREDYIDALKTCKAIVGNSSSGIIEAPALGIPTINVGDRQKGREMASSIINCANTPEGLSGVFDILGEEWFKVQVKLAKSKYDSGCASKKIVDIIKEHGPKVKTNKAFYDWDDNEFMMGL